MTDNDVVLDDRDRLAGELAEQARTVAQRCIDELEEIRGLALLAGVGGRVVELVKAGPARDPRAPRATTRAGRRLEQLGHVAVVARMTLAQLLNLLTPGGTGPDHRLYLVDPPAEGARVDPQARAR